MKKKMTVYTVYMDDGRDCFKVTVPAFSKEDAIKYVEGNGEVIAVKENDLQNIDISCLADTLANNNWGQMEMDVITRALTMVGLDR
jgi:hypothetical protein